MKSARSSRLLLGVIVALGLTEGALAQIPPHVDFHAVWDREGQGEWRLLRDRYRYGPPKWDLHSLRWLTIWNIENPDEEKHVYLDVAFHWLWWPKDPPNVGLTPSPGSTSWQLLPTSRREGDLWYWTLGWIIRPQPRWEILEFPTTDYHLLARGIESVAVGTYCTPEPATLSMLALGGLCFLRWCARPRRGDVPTLET